MHDAYNESKWRFSDVYQTGWAPFMKGAGIAAELCGRMYAPANFSLSLIFVGISANQTCLKWHICARSQRRSQEWCVFIHVGAFWVDCSWFPWVWRRRFRRPLGPVSCAQRAPALSHGADTPAICSLKSIVRPVWWSLVTVSWHKSPKCTDQQQI